MFHDLQATGGIASFYRQKNLIQPARSRVAVPVLFREKKDDSSRAQGKATVQPQLFYVLELQLPEFTASKSQSLYKWKVPSWEAPQDVSLLPAMVIAIYINNNYNVLWNIK